MQIKPSELGIVVAEFGPKGVMKSSHRRLGHEDNENSKVESRRLKTCKPAGAENYTLVNSSNGIATKSIVNAAPAKPRMFTRLPVQSTSSSTVLPFSGSVK